MNLFLRKKNLLTLFLSVSILFSGILFAEENDAKVSPHEIGIYFKDYFPVGSMAIHANDFIGGGVSYAYHSPWLIPVLPSIQNINLGFSARADFEYCFANSYVNNWLVTNILVGTFIELPVNSWLTIQPSIEYGLQMDYLDSTRKANGLYVGQSLQLSPTFKFSLPALNVYGLSIEASPLWSIGFEKTKNANYLGFRLGVSYHIGGTTYSKQEVEDEKIEIVQEEPVEQIENTIPEPEPVVEEPEPVVEEPEPIVEEPEPVVEEPEPVTEVVVVKKVEVKVNDDGTVAINIPTLAFKSNSAELTSAKSNQKTIMQVFEILNDETYAEYKVVITGYVNPDKSEWSDDEKQLALNRAETVKQTLVGMGINQDRLEARHGSGKTDNNEFNRRVEFILTK